MHKGFRGILYLLSFVMSLTTILLWITIPEEKMLNLSTTIFTCTLLGICVYVDFQKYQVFTKSNKFKQLASATTTAFLLFCILGLFNYLGFKHPKQWDFSFAHNHSLTEQSKNIIQDFSEPIIFKIFTRKKNLATFFIKIDQYRFANNLVEKEFIDIDLHPELVKKYNVIKDDTILISYKGRNVFVEELSELGITNALIRVKKDSRPKIYYSIGHQELDFNRQDAGGLSRLKEMIESSNFELVPIELTLQKNIPEDANLLMIIGPQSDFMAAEEKVVDAYITRGGSLFVALDPGTNGDRLPSLRRLLRKWKIDIKNNFVIDRVKFVQGSQTKIPMVNKWPSRHQIVKGFKKPVFFPLVSSVVYTGEPGSFSSLAKTSAYPASWAENSIQEFISGNIIFQKEQDIKGPITLFGAWKSPVNSTRIIAAGNSSFITNTYEKFGGNHHLVLNSVSWLVNEEKLISFNTPIIKNTPVFLAPGQISLIFFFTVILIPLLLISTSILFYRRRLKL